MKQHHGEMKISGIVPWYGAKRKAQLLAPIMAEIQSPMVLIEPFCGSCAVSLASKANIHIVNDLHRQLFNLALCLKEPETCEILYEQASRMVFSEALAHDQLLIVQAANDSLIDVPDVSAAVSYLYVCWTSHNGFAGTTIQPRFNVRFSAGGGDPATRWRSVADSIPEWHNRMRTWTITNRDALLVLESTPDNSGTVIYCDSPYHHSVRSAAKYLHDFAEQTLFQPINHHLVIRDILASFKEAKVVISHYDCPHVRELYDGWRFIENTQAKSIANASGSPAEAPEVIITNQRK